MKLKKSVAKLDEYNRRLEEKKADQIKPAHVEQVLDRLHAKRSELEEELKTAEKPGKKDRLTRKIALADDQISRAEWLLQEIGKAK